METSGLEESDALLEEGVDGRIEDGTDGTDGFDGRFVGKVALPDPRILPPLAVFGIDAIEAGFIPNHWRALLEDL